MKRVKHLGKKKLGLRRRTVRKLEPETVAPVRGGLGFIQECSRKYSGCNPPPIYTLDCLA